MPPKINKFHNLFIVQVFYHTGLILFLLWFSSKPFGAYLEMFHLNSPYTYLYILLFICYYTIISWIKIITAIINFKKGLYIIKNSPTYFRASLINGLVISLKHIAIGTSTTVSLGGAPFLMDQYLEFSGREPFMAKFLGEKIDFLLTKIGHPKPNDPNLFKEYIGNDNIPNSYILKDLANEKIEELTINLNSLANQLKILKLEGSLIDTVTKNLNDINEILDKNKLKGTSK